MQSDVVTTMMRPLTHGGGVATLPAPARAIDLICQRLMSRWNVSEKAARGMIAIEQSGGAPHETAPPRAISGIRPAPKPQPTGRRMR